ncbi:hypothetical protein ACIBF1_18790 [Spirillospora sp. NPDC050679]
MTIACKTLILSAALGAATALWATPAHSTATTTAQAQAVTAQAWCGPGKVWDPILHKCVPY